MASVDLVARLLHQPTWVALLQTPAMELFARAAEQGLRSVRPQAIPELDRLHDLDAEAEFLDWGDAHAIDWTDAGLLADLGRALHGGAVNIQDAADGLRILSEIASPGAFRCWEGRAMLYLDVLTGREIQDLDDLYSEAAWLAAMDGMRRSDPAGYSEAVVLDWMKQREALGETLDASKDPRLIPTQQAHEGTADRLHRTLQSADVPELMLLVGRDWTDPSAWGHGAWNLGRMIREGLQA